MSFLGLPWVWYGLNMGWLYSHILYILYIYLFTVYVCICRVPVLCINTPIVLNLDNALVCPAWGDYRTGSVHFWDRWRKCKEDVLFVSQEHVFEIFCLITLMDMICVLLMHKFRCCVPKDLRWRKLLLWHLEVKTSRGFDSKNTGACNSNCAHLQPQIPLFEMLY